MFIEIIGWSGAALVLMAYALLAMRRLVAASYAYHALNIIGAVFLAFYAYYKTAWATVAINALWAVIGVAAVMGMRRRLNKRTPNA